MPPSSRRRPSGPDPDALAEMTRPAGRLTKAADEDPVLAVTRHTPALEQTPAAPARRTTAPDPNAPQTKTKSGIFWTNADADRARATWANMPMPRPRTFSDFLALAARQLCDQIEQEHNHGNPWPPLPAGEIATGRPRD